MSEKYSPFNPHDKTQKVYLPIVVQKRIPYAERFGWYIIVQRAKYIEGERVPHERYEDLPSDES